MVIRRVLVFGIVSAIVSMAAVASAQSTEMFKGHLSPLPVTGATAPLTLGSGSFTATLRGNVLTISGKFEGMNSPATVAHIHRAQKARRGPVVLNLMVTPAPSGIVTGELTLTMNQVDELRKGWYYIQIHAEKNPDGQLRGWILK